MGGQYARIGAKIFLIGLVAVIASRTVHRLSGKLDGSLPF
jgi:hypothetical protein